MDMEHIVAAAVTLFFVLDPLGNAPVAYSILQEVEPRKRSRIMMRELLFVLALLLLFFFLGAQILGMLGISRSSLNLSGGMMLLLISIGMIFPSVNVVGNSARRTQRVEPFLVPVAVPLVVGPAAISLVMVQASACVGAEERMDYIMALVLAWGATAAIMMCSGRVLDYLGEKGAMAMTRLMGTLLVLIAVQMMLNGVTDYISSLPSAP